VSGEQIRIAKVRRDRIVNKKVTDDDVSITFPEVDSDCLIYGLFDLASDELV
jgi:hypothetical protein